MTLSDCSLGLSNKFLMSFLKDLNKSISKLEPTFCNTEQSLSSPIPVSTHLLGNGLNSPAESLLNSMKTKFHISTNLSPVSPSPGGDPS